MIPGTSCALKPLPGAKANNLLAALPDEVFARWLPMLELVKLPKGKVIYNPQTEIPSVYFPTSAIVSLVCATREGQSIEVAIIGNDGIVGVVAFMSGQSALDQSIVQRTGMAYRLRSQVVDLEFQQNSHVRNLLLRYAQALMVQLEQTAVCNRLHKLDQQLSRWLLMCLDRIVGDEVLVTQDVLANILGVRRESVTAAAMRLRDEGLIRYARGHIQVLDRTGLQHRACECYSVVKSEYDRLLGPRYVSARKTVASSPNLVATDDKPKPTPGALG